MPSPSALPERLRLMSGSRNVRSIIIIGAGLAGVASAYELTRRGVRVTLLEANADAGAATSYAPGGIFTPSMPEPWNSPGVGKHLVRSLFDPGAAMKLRIRAIPSLFFWGLKFLRHSTPAKHAYATEASFLLAHFSTQIAKQWRDDEGLRFDSEDGGTLKIFRSKADMAGPVKTADKLAPHGLNFHILNPEQTVEKEPLLATIRDQIAGAIFYPDDIRGDAHQFTKSLLARAIALGAEFRSRTQVDEILREEGRVTGVRIGDETLVADAVLVAAASFSRQLLRPLGIRLPVRPAKGYSVTLTPRDDNRVPLRPVVDDAMHAAVIPLGRRIRIAGTAEFTGENLRIDEARIDNLIRLFTELYPDLAESLKSMKVEKWTGLRPMSADGLPFIGPSRLDGLYLNTGHGHLGLTFAAGSAVLLADQILGQTPAIDPHPYDATR